MRKKPERVVPLQYRRNGTVGKEGLGVINQENGIGEKIATDVIVPACREDKDRQHESGGAMRGVQIRGLQKRPKVTKGSRINNFTFLALRFRLGLVDFKEQKAQ